KSADGVSIKYEVSGKDSGVPVLVFVHGWCCDRTYWEKQVPYFSKHYKVVTFDLAGHGESAMGRKKYTLQAFGQDVAAVVKALDLKKVILVGHSMGGPIVAMAAPMLPNRVIGIVGVDTFNNIEVKLTKEIKDMVLVPLRKDFVKGTRDFISFFMFTPDADPVLKEKVLKDMASSPPEVGIGAMEEMLNDDIPAILDRAKVPLHCINSDQFPTNVESIKRHTVSFEIKILPRSHHFLMLEKPDEFNKLLHETVNEMFTKK
ncbi:MAG: alpha/beta hydrolase, partial [bacterium]|nr:alpha/beta hydrolase [bacterium]